MVTTGHEAAARIFSSSVRQPGSICKPAWRAVLTKPGKEVATFATSRDLDRRACLEGCDREGHRDAVIAVAVDAAAAEACPRRGCHRPSGSS